MKKKQIGSLFLTAVLILSLAACKNNGQEADAPVEGQTGSSSKASSGSAADSGSSVGDTAAATTAVGASNAEESGEIDRFGFDHEVRIKVGFAWGQDFEFKNGDDSMNNPWMTLYREHNIVPELLYEVDSSQGDTKLSTAIMSGNYPDILGIKANEYTKMVQTGVIADITDSLETYATPELMEYLTVDNGLAMDATKIDGRIYGLPNMGNSYDSMKVMFVREDWLERLGLSMPETMEELKAVAHAFTYDDPDGNGVDDTYGLALDGVNVLSDSVGTVTGVFEGFGAYPTSLTFIEKDGRVVWGGTAAAEMKSALSLLQEMYADGSIARDFITMDSNAIFEEAGAGRCGIFFAPMWGAMTSSYNAAAIDPNARFISAPVPAGTGITESKALFTSGYGQVYAVSSKCQNPEVLVKLMNLSVQKLCHPESEEEFNTYYGNGDYAAYKACLTNSLPPLKNYDNYLKESAALKSGDYSELNIEQRNDCMNMQSYLDMLKAGSFDTEDPVFRAGSGLYTVFGNPKGSYAALDTLIRNDRFVYAVYNTLPTEKMSEVESTLNKMLVEKIVKIITGDSVDSYDTFLESWRALGGDEITGEAQEWADSVTP